MPKSLFHSDRQRAKIIIPIIYEAYEKRTHLFRWIRTETHAPQHKYVPAGMEKGSPEHSLFLFFCILLTYRSSSDKWFEQCVEMRRKYPQLFTDYVLEATIGEIQQALKEVGYIYHQSGAYRWKGSGDDLFKKYLGNPTLIYQDANSISEIIEKKSRLSNGRSFLTGYGPKLLSLLMILYYELGLVEKYFPDAFPADVHIQNQCLSAGIVRSSKKIINSTLLAEHLRELIAETCSRESLSVLKLSHAMWFTGSLLCVHCNSLRPAVRKECCSLEKFCQGRINTDSYHKKGKWDLREKNNQSELPLFPETKEEEIVLF